MRKALLLSAFLLVLTSVLFKVAYENSEALIETSSPDFTGKVLEAPRASFTYTPGYPYMGDQVTFNASSSTPDGGLISYLWNFGDGTSLNAADPIATHVYTAAGNYTVTLTVTDSESLSDTATETITVKQAPIAVFTYSPYFSITNQTVAFNASDSNDPNGYIVSYGWNFGDGNITTTNTSIITHVYTAEGNYVVVLTVTDNEGYVDTAIDVVRVRNYPTASFIYSPEFPFVNETVTFNASSSTPNGGVITTYGWNFGDGNITIVSTPIIIHVYKVSGSYTVKLAVTDDEGLTNYQSKTIWIRGYPSAAFIYTPIEPFAGDNVTFNASPSTANGGVIVSYFWDFGDGSQSVNETDPITTHIYDAGGNYAVTLTVVDNNGYTDTTTSTVKVKQFPVASFTYTPNFPIAGEMITFNASDSYDADGYIVSYEWDFGDGNITTDTTATITHTYMTSGNYTVTVGVTDNDGLTDTATYTVRVRGYPIPIFTWSPLKPQASESVTFNASSSTPEGGVILSYEWDFGDGNITTVFDPVIVHHYSTFGYYYVTLTVVDNEGLSGNESKTVQVIAAPEANFTWQPSVPLVNETITFDASTSVPNGGIIVIYVWDFGDGSSPVLVLFRPTVTHRYANWANYTVTLNVTDSEGLSDTASQTLSVHAAIEPQANFSYLPRAPCIFETVAFNASASTPGVGTIISYTWNFGDGNITTVTEPLISHIYSAEGNYTVTLTVTDVNGRSDSIIQIIKVRSRPIYDINGDGVIDIRDIAIVAKAYGSQLGDPNWNIDADVNGDDKVDIKDIAIVAIHYGEYV